ncbi:MAG: Crp/Fnr family transcriptional regulator [Acidiferrobacteraceae bacterium]
MPAISDVSANWILKALSRRDRQRLQAHCTPVTLEYGDVLYDPGERIRRVYFPHDSLVSLLTPIDGGWSEVGLVGNEGIVGATLALGVPVSAVRMLVQGTGSALRMNSALFLREIKGNAALRQQLDYYLYRLLVQTSQTAACNLLHLVRPCLVRWLLLTQDRMLSSEFQLTQDFLARMLGIRRASVAHAAAILQKEKLIRYSRGRFMILDRKGLERAACTCYSIGNTLCAGAH